MKLGVDCELLWLIIAGTPSQGAQGHNDCNKEGKSKMNLCQYEFRHSVNVLIREVSLFKGEHTPTIMRTSTVSNALLN